MAEVNFAREIQPLFEKHCYECHGPKQQKNGFRLDRRSRAMAGVVRDISTDSTKDDALGLVYPTRIKLAQSSMRVDGRDTPLTPGMRVTVDVITDERRVIEFILSPLLRMRNDGLRQR